MTIVENLCYRTAASAETGQTLLAASRHPQKLQKWLCTPVASRNHRNRRPCHRKSLPERRQSHRPAVAAQAGTMVMPDVSTLQAPGSRLEQARSLGPLLARFKDSIIGPADPLNQDRHKSMSLLMSGPRCHILTQTFQHTSLLNRISQ